MASRIQTRISARSPSRRSSGVQRIWNKRRVIIENIPVGDQPLRPGPDDVQVLGLVGIKAKDERVVKTGRQNQGEKEGQKTPLGQGASRRKRGGGLENGWALGAAAGIQQESQKS